MGSIQRRLLKVVLAIVARPRLTVAICLLALGGCVAFALLRLNIDTDEDQLFSPNVPFFREYLTFEDKFPENEALLVLIYPADPKTQPPLERWTGLADAMAARLNSMPKLVISAEAGVDPDKLGPQGILYDDPKSVQDDFNDARGLARLAQLWGKPTLITSLLGRTPMERFLHGVALQPASAQTTEFVNALVSSWTRALGDADVKVPDLMKLKASDPGDLGYNYDVDYTDVHQHLLSVEVYLTDL